MGQTVGWKVAWSCHSTPQGLELMSIWDMKTFTALTSVNEVPS